MNNFIRSSSAIIPATVITFFLFLGMYWLVNNNNHNRSTSDENISINFTPMKIDDEIQDKSRTKPKEPEKPKPQPKMNISLDTHVEKPNQEITNPKIDKSGLKASDYGLNIGSGTTDGNYSGDGGIITLVAIAPNYPRKALIAKIEGWVKVEFTVTAAGTVINPKVIKAKPAQIFNSEALRAISKYRFKPRRVNGQAVSQVATQTIEFKLDKN